MFYFPGLYLFIYTLELESKQWCYLENISSYKCAVRYQKKLPSLMIHLENADHFPNVLYLIKQWGLMARMCFKSAENTQFEQFLWNVYRLSHDNIWSRVEASVVGRFLNGITETMFS